MPTIVHCPISLNTFICFNPSIADVTEIGGVMIPSERTAEPPIIAGITAHFPCRRTRAKRENIPPSPLLSAFKVRMTYFIVVCRVSVQMIQDKPPRIKSSVTIFPFTIALKTYNGDVPISPYMIPTATTKPASVTLLVGILTNIFLLTVHPKCTNHPSKV